MSSILIIDDTDKYWELCTRFMPEHEFLPPARNDRIGLKGRSRSSCFDQRARAAFRADSDRSSRLSFWARASADPVQGDLSAARRCPLGRGGERTRRAGVSQ